MTTVACATSHQPREQSPDAGGALRTAVVRAVSVARQQRGVTLTELLVALAVGLVTVAAVYGVHLMQVNRQVVQDDVMTMRQTTRAVLDMLTREIRMAGYDPMGANRDADPSNNFDGLICRHGEVQIRADLNGNGTLLNRDKNGDTKAIRNPNETITWQHDADASTLRRRTGTLEYNEKGRVKYAQVVAGHVTSFTVTCLDAHGHPTAHTPAVRDVDVRITTRSAHVDRRYPDNDGYRTFTLHSRIAPRNLQ